ncbi:MAG: hypothetical protein QOJ06_609 [Pseudonocardiales bacterium]|jgi:hypothetical protein|nr:hypothetical protein [Pseudonocardiales bacterium]
MCDTVGFAALDREYVELLPPRTVLSTVSPQIPIGDASSNGIGDDVISGAMSMLGMTGGNHGTDGSNGPSK